MGHKCNGANLFLLDGWDLEADHKIDSKFGLQLVELEDDGGGDGTFKSCEGQ